MTPPLFVGVEIGGTKLQVAAGSSPPDILRLHREQVRPELGARGILDGMARGLEAVCQGRRPAAAGAAFGGPLDRTEGRVVRSHQIPGWEGFRLREWLEDRLAAPALLDNDANLACLAEATCGAAMDRDPVLYVTLGSGVGAGLCAGGAIYHGAPPGECELGHLRINEAGETLESLCSGWAVDREIRKLAGRHPGSPLARHAALHGGCEARALAPALAESDPLALALLERTAGALALGLSHAIHLFHPQAVVLGGGLSLAGPFLAEAAARALPPLLMEAMHPPPPILAAGLGEETVPKGALLLARMAAAAR